MSRSWKNPHTGKSSSMDDVVEISLTRDQLGAYHRALFCAIDHAEEARGTQGKMSFLATIVELSDKAMIAIYRHDQVPPSEWDQDLRARNQALVEEAAARLKNALDPR